MKELKEKLEQLEQALFVCECADRMNWVEYRTIKEDIKKVQQEIKALS